MSEDNITMESFMTQAVEDEGLRFYLPLPNGKPTNQWIQVLGKYSKEAQTAWDANVKKIRAAAGDESRMPDLIDEFWCKIIVAWSFDVPCNKANIRKFLHGSGYLTKFLDEIHSQTDRYFLLGFSPSSKKEDTLNESSSSGSATKTATPKQST